MATTVCVPAWQPSWQQICIPAPDLGSSSWHKHRASSAPRSMTSRILPWLSSNFAAEAPNGCRRSTVRNLPAAKLGNPETGNPASSYSQTELSILPKSKILARKNSIIIQSSPTTRTSASGLVIRASAFLWSKSWPQQYHQNWTTEITWNYYEKSNRFDDAMTCWPTRITTMEQRKRSSRDIDADSNAKATKAKTCENNQPQA